MSYPPTTPNPDNNPTITRANRILTALYDARAALVELSDAFHDTYFSGPGGTHDRDNAVEVAYHLAHSSNLIFDGGPVPMLTTDHGDDLLRRAANIRQQIKEFALDLVREVPATFQPQTP
jgi:hypothetical protein